MSAADNHTAFIPSTTPDEIKPGYEKAETDLLQAALKRTHLERLLFATRLYKIQQTLKKAKLTHQPFLPPKST